MKNSGLKVVFRSQELRRAQTRIRDGVLRYRSARPQPGDELCCPTAVAETRLRWRERLHEFTVAERREIAAHRALGRPAPRLTVVRRRTNSGCAMHAERESGARRLAAGNAGVIARSAASRPRAVSRTGPPIGPLPHLPTQRS